MATVSIEPISIMSYCNVFTPVRSLNLFSLTKSHAITSLMKVDQTFIEVTRIMSFALEHIYGRRIHIVVGNILGNLQGA